MAQSCEQTHSFFSPLVIYFHDSSTFRALLSRIGSAFRRIVPNHRYNAGTSSGRSNQRFNILVLLVSRNKRTEKGLYTGCQSAVAFLLSDSKCVAVR